MNRFLSDARLSLHFLSIAAFLAAMTICAGAGAVVVSNPTFTATLDQALTFNAVNYSAGDPIPQGTYVTNSGSGAGLTLRYQSTDLAVDSNTASFLGWVATDNIATGVSDPSEITSGLTDAGNVGRLTTYTPFGDGGVISLTQDLGIPFQPNSTYTLSLDLLLKSVPLTPLFYADLTAGGTRVFGTQVKVDPTQLTLGSDIVTFTTGAIAPVGNLGIVLHAEDTTGNLTQILVDNISLTNTPEPASMGLLALGGLRLLLRRRRMNFAR